MMASESSQSLSLKVLLEKEKNQVIFAESNKDFVDVLFSFMTMPIGIIIKLARQYSLEVDFGCLNNLYQTVENLDKEHFRSMKCKDMLLHPPSAAEIYCRNLKLNVVDSDTNEYYTCGAYHIVSCYPDAYCQQCRSLMCYAWNLNNSSFSVHQDKGVFVKPTTRFIISDDFHVKPMSTITGLTRLSKFGATDRSIREERTTSIGKDKVMKLLVCSLTSRAPLSETILESDKNSSHNCHKKYGPRSTFQCQRAMNATKNKTNISLKLIINKSNNRLLYAEAKEDFVDVIGSFLTIPLGYVFENFTCLSMRGCLGNLYKSIQDFDTEVCFKSEEMKSILVNPKLPRGLAFNKQLLPIEEASYPSYSTACTLFNVSNMGKAEYLHGETVVGMGFISVPSMFMVTDDFTITPLSSFSGISFIDRLNIPLSDILEQEVTMSEEEALRLLEAALVSKTALTDVFMPDDQSKQKLNDWGEQTIKRQKLKEDSDN